MAAATTQAAPKSSKKKATKALERTESPAPSAGSSPADKAAESTDEFETPYIKELHKNIRNANKKLAAASKTDAILAQHPGKSLEDLVVDRVINADQKAQILKKPALQAQIAQFEEQLTQYQKVHEQYQAKTAADKAEWEKTLDKAREDAANEAKEEALASLKDSLLTLSEFLRLAAYRREEAKDPESDESQAIEGVLLAIYSGDQNAVSAMLKLINGSSEQIISVPGEQLQTTYAAIADLAKTYQGPQSSEGAQEPEAQAAADEPTDATPVDAAAAAAAAENGTDNAAPINEQSPADVTTNGHANSSVAEDSTTAGEASYDSSATKDETSISQEWVDVASPKESTDAEPAAEVVVEVSDATETKKQFWADDHPENTEAAATPDANDGFHQVQRNRGRQDREGGERSQGRGRGRGEWRGRGGHRGDGRGRGRGSRGGAGAPSRPPRRTEES